MRITEEDRQQIRQELVECLRGQAEVRRIVLFGSFLTSGEPNDLDVAVFQDSEEPYPPLALKYRRLLWPVADRIPVDVLPLRASAGPGCFVRDEALSGEVIYER